MRKIALILLVVTLLVMGCGKKNTNSEVVQVTFWHALGGPLGDVLTEMVDEFNQTHKDIKVNAVSMGNYQALSQKLMASIQAGNQPDISQVYESWTADLIKSNIIVPIDSFISKDAAYQESVKDIYPVFLESNRFNGKIWSYPFNKSLRVLYYNKDMFYKNGIDPNKAPVTWADFRAYAKKLTKDTNHDGKPEIWGTSITVSAWQFENLLLQAGGEIMSKDNKKVLFNSPEGVKALGFMTDLLNKDKTAYLSTGYEGQNDFLAGKVAMLEGSSVSLAFMKKNGIPFNLGICAIPVDKTKRSIISGTNVAIFKTKNEKAREAAWEFVKWFTDKKQTAKFASVSYYMPVRISAFDEDSMTKMIKEDPQMQAVFGQLEQATYEPQIGQWFETRKELEEQVIERVLRNALKPAEALNKTAGELQKKLN